MNDKNTTNKKNKSMGDQRFNVEKPKDFKKTFRTLTVYLKPYWGVLILVLVLAIAGTLCAIIGPMFLGDMTDVIIKGIKGGMDFSAIKRVGLILIGLYSISAIFNYIQGWIMTGVAQKITYNFRRDISLKI